MRGVVLHFWSLRILALYNYKALYGFCCPFGLFHRLGEVGVGGELFEVFAVDGWGLRERVIFLMELFDRAPVW